MKTPPTEPAAARVAALPCWRGAVEPQPLAGGLSNHNYLVDDGGAKFVARIGGDAPMHNVMRFNEQACGRAAATLGLAPRQIHAAAESQVIEFIDGKTLDAAAVRRCLARLLPPLQTLHQAGAGAVRGAVLWFSVFHVIRHYGRLLADSRRHAAARPELMAAAEQLEAAVGAITPALCHNDLLAANFIDDGARIWIIDWEHAGINTPLFDLANLAANNAFPEALEREMLQLYYGAAPDAALWRRFKAFCAASHLRETWWSMAAEIHADLDHDYAAYTAKNLANFHHARAQFQAL